MIESLTDILTDLPAFLDRFIENHGLWVYALLFAIIFAETGLVIAPFLPGDSLLFTVGALAARMPEHMSFWPVTALLVVAAVLGDAVNYAIGAWLGPRIFRFEVGSNSKPSLFVRMLNRKHLERAHAFYEKYGGKAVVLGRFVPIVRTFVPFVAGAGAMRYRTFFLYNVLGAVLWVGICTGAGFFFGNLDFVKRHFEAVIVGIVVVSVMPVGIEWLMARRRDGGTKGRRGRGA